MENKPSGEESELAFCMRAVQHGLSIAIPWGDSRRYDVVVDTGPQLWRVQIKSSSRERGGYYFIGCKHGRGARYSVLDADFIAAHIQPLDLWYILPMSVASNTTGIAIKPLADNISRYSQYEEAWHLFNNHDANQATEPSSLSAPPDSQPPDAGRDEARTIVSV